ncbi:MAG: macro domain-containing protein, partial [Thermoanaerobaculia bacterium]
LTANVVIHCVASNARHQSSPEIVRACVRNALARCEESGCRSIALPVFATGHARLPFDQALRVIVQELAGSRLEHAYIVINDEERIEDALAVIREYGFDPEVHRSLRVDEVERSSWF